MADEDTSDGRTGQIQVEYYAPEETPTVYSDAVFVVHTENEFVLSFYQSQFPAITEETARDLKSVRSRCIVRIILSPKQMRKTTEAFAGNLAKYDKKSPAQQGD